MFLKTIEVMRYVKSLKFQEGMRDFMIAELKTKSQIADNASTAREIQSASGDWVLHNESCMHLLPWINDYDFDHILLTWHVATDLCFHTDNLEDSADMTVRGLSRWLSDYMFYLLMWQPAMISSVDAQGMKRFNDTCVEVRKFLREKNLLVKKWEGVEVLSKACGNILSSYEEVNKSTSVLMDARNLAEKLRELGIIRKREVMSRVWMELLCYAAIHCKAGAHLEQIQQGGSAHNFCLAPHDSFWHCQLVSFWCLSDGPKQPSF